MYLKEEIIECGYTEPIWLKTIIWNAFDFKIDNLLLKIALEDLKNWKIYTSFNE